MKNTCKIQVAFNKNLELLTHSSLILLRCTIPTLQPPPSYSNNIEGSWTLMLASLLIQEVCSMSERGEQGLKYSKLTCVNPKTYYPKFCMQNNHLVGGL
jgi:hypothetical protein